MFRPLSNVKTIVWFLSALLLVVAVACGSSATATPRPVVTSTPGSAAEPTATVAAVVPTAETSPVAGAEGYWKAFLDQGKYGGILIEGHTYEADHWSPWVGCCNRSIYVARNPFNALVMRDPTDQVTIVGDLATSWVWAEDGNSVNFHLAENATWFDGQPVTAEDVVFSLDEMSDLTKVRPRTRNLAPYYSSSEAIDPNTVKLNTSFPNPAALIPFLTVDFMVIHPKHILADKPGDPADFFTDPENIVGSGAFMYKGRELGSSMELEKNPNYFKEGLPFLDGIKVFILSDKARLAAALEVGQVDFTPGGGWTQNQLNDLIAALEGKGVVPITPVDNIFRWIQFNFNNAPTSDPRVRRALYIAMDSKELVEIARLGVGGLATPFFPNTWMSASDEEVSEWIGFRYVDEETGELYIGNPIGVPGLVQDPADLQLARDLLAEAGFPDGITLDYHGATNFQEEAVIVQQQWKRIGVELNMKITDLTTGVNVEQSGEYTHILGLAHGTNIIDPDDVFIGAYNPGGPRNALKYEDPRITEIFERQKSETDQVKRRAIIKEAEDILRFGEAHGFPMFWHPAERFVHTNKVKNVVAAWTVQYGYQKEHIWLDEG